jgi:hypothetical protein
MPYPFKDDALKAYLDAEKVALMPEQQYFDSYRLDAGGVTTLPNGEVKKKLGFTDVQRFSKAMLDATRLVASTSLGDDCGEGAFSSDWSQSTFANANRPPDNWVLLQPVPPVAPYAR